MSLHLSDPWHGYSEKLTLRHLERLAVVYVRQSTMQQVLDHQESTRLQYGLVQRAMALGGLKRASWSLMKIWVSRAPRQKDARGSSVSWPKSVWIMWAWC